MVTTHYLKTLPEHFSAVWDGTKRAELRRDDRGFVVGDVLRLREWDEAYFGREIVARITHVLRGGPWLADGYVMLSIEVLECKEATE